MLIKYQCCLCENHIEKIVATKEQVIGALPCQCGGWLERILGAPSSNSTESINSGSIVNPVYYDKDRVKMARQQGDDLLREHNKKNNGES